MGERMKIKIVQSLTGAVVLTALMQLFIAFGFGQYVWMLFFPLLLFFALGADFKKIPSMIVCYVCGVAWTYINGIVQGILGMFASEVVVEIVSTILVIFLILTVHEGLLANTIFANVPCLFLGMCTTFFVFMMNVELTPVHLIGFYLYGIFLSIALVLVGMGVCSAIFGKERAFKALVGNYGQKNINEHNEQA